VKRLFVTLVLVLVACARHDDPLPPIDVVEPPAPKNLIVETTDQITYHLSWEIDDPMGVKKYFRVYSRFQSSSPAFEDTTSTTAVQVVAPLPIPGISFCVSTVTHENVESRLLCEPAE
jgi:hypothetical protein